MFSRLKFIVMASTVGLLSCTPKIGEKPPDPNNIELGSTKCLSQSARDLKNFFSAKVSEGELRRAWSCVELAFVQFEKYVRGRDKDRFTSQEIVDFLKKNFFDDELQKQDITPAFQIEIMKLKQIFLGGDLQYVTRDELKKTKAFIQNVSQLTVDLNPFMKVIVMEWNPELDANRSEDLEAFEKANIAFQVFAKALANMIKVNTSQYKIEDLLNLFKETEKFFGDHWTWIEEVEKGIPAAKKLKYSLAGGDENIITNEEWPPVLTLGARGYFQYLRYHYFIKATPETGGGVRLIYIARTLEDVFSIFHDLLTDRKDGVITRQEIYDILKSFEAVWDDLKVSEKLILEFMKIKQVLVGGSLDNWTAADFEQARLKVPELRRIIENFLTYYSIYAFEWEPDQEQIEKSRKLFEEAKVRLYVVAQDISRFLQGSYSYKDFLDLIQEMETLYPEEEAFKQLSFQSERLSNELEKYESLFTEVNQLLFNRNDSVVNQESWTVLLPMVARFYSLYQYYDYFLADKNFKKTQTIKDLGVMVDSGLTLSHDLLQVKKEGYFTQDELVKLSLTLSEAGVLPKNVSKETYQSLWTAILQHVLFDPARRLNGEKNTHLTMDQFDILAREFKNWRLAQIELNEMYSDNLENSMKPDELLKSLKQKIKENEKDPELTKGLTDVYTLLDAPVSQTLDSEDQLQISSKISWVYRLNALFQANLSRTLSKLLLNAFSMEKELRRVTECDAQKAFKLLAGAFRDLGIFNPSETFISSRFLEANIFMIRGNGDKFLDGFELSELITVIFSGLEVNSKLENSIRTVCPVNLNKDLSERQFVTFKCLSEHHYVAVRKYMTQLPEFKAYVDKLASKDPVPTYLGIHDQSEDDGPSGITGEFKDVATRPGFADWNIVFRATLKATGWVPNKGYGDVKQESVYFKDALYYPFVVHYMEYLYARFDTTKNNVLQAGEARKAFPTFKPLLKDLAKEQLEDGLIKESDLLAVFTFILKYREEPGLSNVFRWLWWKSNEDKWDIWVTRTEMAQTLGFIADKANAMPGSGPNKCK